VTNLTDLPPHLTHLSLSGCIKSSDWKSLPRTLTRGDFGKNRFSNSMHMSHLPSNLKYLNINDERKEDFANYLVNMPSTLTCLQLHSTQSNLESACVLLLPRSLRVLHIDYGYSFQSKGPIDQIIDFASALPRGLVDLKIITPHSRIDTYHLREEFFTNLPHGLRKLDVSGYLRVANRIQDLPPSLTLMNIWHWIFTEGKNKFDNSLEISHLPQTLTELSLNYQTQWDDDNIASLPRGLEVLVLPECPLISNHGINLLPKRLQWLNLKGSCMLTESVSHLLPPGTYPKPLFPNTKGMKNRPSV
jgi:hypothetical protein